MLLLVAVVAFDRLRMLWGGLDWQHGSNTPYNAAQTAVGGTSAAPGPGNIGVRRATLVLDRTGFTPADDDINMHFDWLNITSGAPDDTWTTADYTTMEGFLTTFMTSMKPYWDLKMFWREVRWYRHGPGVVAPNPAERVYSVPAGFNGSGTAGLQIPQAATTITFRTAIRRSWGRTYLPFTGFALNTQGRISSTQVDTICTAAQQLVVNGAGSDFRLVVTSIPKMAALNVERVEVDDVPDVIRRRRWKHTGYRKLLP